MFLFHVRNLHCEHLIDKADKIFKRVFRNVRNNRYAVQASQLATVCGFQKRHVVVVGVLKSVRLCNH